MKRPWKLGMGLALAALVLAVVLWPRQWQVLERSRAQPSATAVPAAAAAPVATPRGDALATPGLPGFAPVEARPQRQAALLQHFRRSGLEAVQGEFRASEDGGGALDRVVVQLSARGSMAAVRHALADAMQADPGLALERLRLVRESPAANQVQAELRLALLSSRERAP